MIEGAQPLVVLPWCDLAVPPPLLMSTTSLKLPEALKQRAAAVAQQRGVSAHAFMVDAIAQATRAAEQRADFVADALAARDQLLASGMGYEGDEVHAWLRARAAGRKTSKPKARPWRG